MDLSTYEELTGTTVDAANIATVEAQLLRVQRILESKLGFTLDSDLVQENLYNELGKSQQECACPSVDIGDLEDPDEVEGAYRLFNYNYKDEYFHIDPFSVIHRAKLVYIRPGDGDQGVTLKTFDEDEIRVHMSQGGLTKYLEHCRDCLCFCECRHCVQLAVDADWLWPDDLPDDLLYLWADMVTHYTDCNVDIKSETIGAHSYTKVDSPAPEELSASRAIIARYAGPFGSASPNYAL